MWNRHESQSVSDLYSKIEIDQFEVAKCFNDLQWFSIVESGQAKNVSHSSHWYRVPQKSHKLPAVGRFQYLIYDEGEKDGTDRWRRFFKELVKQLEIHPSRTNIVQIGFSFLAVHPLKLAREKPNAYVYVSFILCLEKTKKRFTLLWPWPLINSNFLNTKKH